MDDSDFVSSSLKPSRTTSTCKKASSERCEQSTSNKFTIESDCLLPNSNERKCFVCDKDVGHLNELRRAIHINNCLDQQETKSKHESDKEKWAQTVDCPICGTPLQPGPFRAAHAKSCGRKHEVPGVQLLSLMDTQTKVANVKKKHGMTHTKKAEPKLVHKKAEKNKNEPKSEFDEQMKMAMAMSASLDPLDDCVSVPAPKLPARSSKQRPRSYSFVEMQPRSCRCAVFEQIQQNFVGTFKVKRYGGFADAMRRRKMRSSRILGDICKCVHKLARLERLADDLRRFGSSGGDVTMFSLENESIPVHRFILAARAPSLLPLIGLDGSLPLRDYSAAALRCFVSFLYSSAMEWRESERDDVLQLAKLYGPDGLATLCSEPDPCLEKKTVDDVITKKDGGDVMATSEGGELIVAETEEERNAKPSSEEHDKRIVSNDLDIAESSFLEEEMDVDEAVRYLERQHSRSGSSAVNAHKDKAQIKHGSLPKGNEKEKQEPILDAIEKQEVQFTQDVKHVNDNINRTKEERKGFGSRADSECSVIVLDDVFECVGGRVKPQNESEAWDMESSGGWLDALLPPRESKQSSVKKVQDDGNTSYPSCDVPESNTTTSRTLTARRSQERSSPDIFGESSEDDNCEQREKIRKSASKSQKFSECDRLQDDAGKVKDASAAKGMDIELTSDLLQGISEDWQDVESAIHEEVRQCPARESDKRSLSPSFVYSPLPLPPDSFDYFVRLSPDDFESDDVPEGSRNASPRNPVVIGCDHLDRLHAAVGCLPSTSAPDSSLHLNTGEMPDSFFDSRPTQPIAPTSLVRYRSGKLSDILCSSPLQAKRQRRRNASESPKSSHRPPKVPKIQEPGWLRDERKAPESSTSNTHIPVVGILSTMPFGVPVSPIRRYDPQPCSSRTQLRSPTRSKTIKMNTQYCSTPNACSSKLAQRLKELGSNVKVLKTSNITPIPKFETMNDKQLKEELCKYGVRPMGRKRSIALLKKIYEEMHPVIELGSPVTSKRNSSKIVTSLTQRLEEGEGDGDKTLNETLDEDDIREESCLDAFDEDAPLPKDLDGMQTALLVWLRRKDNQDLYNTLLGLNPIIFEELCDRLSRADSAVASIPKKALVEIMDRLHITFSLPADGWKRRREKKQKTKGK